MPDSSIRGLLAMLVLFCGSAVGCGGGQPPPEPKPEDQVRDVVADYYQALFAFDGPAACDVLTVAGQRRVVLAANQTPRVPAVESCEEVFDYLGSSTGFPPEDEAELEELVARIRSGEEEAFAVRIDGDEAVVGPGTSRSLEITLSYVENGWLIENGLDPLFDFGIDDLPR